MAESKGVHLVWLVVATLLMAFALLAGYLDQRHFFYHVRVTRVLSTARTNHEAKECASWNAKAEQSVLECDNGHSELQQTVPVRFYGDTRRPLDSETLRFYWACRKNEASRPVISCQVAPQP
jgi:hypothetical protein